MNNLLKNIGIWLVIGLVVLTVVKQFDSRQTTRDTVPYSEFMPKGFDWKASTAIRTAEADARDALGSTGRILLRPSGTEPVLRVMVEAADRSLADTCAQRVADSIAATFAAAAD